MKSLPTPGHWFILQARRKLMLSFRAPHQSVFMAATALTPFLVGVSAQAQSDDFNDNTIGSQWTLLQDAPTELSLSEINGRLEAASSPATSPNTDALYLSNGTGGFRLATDTDFEITIDYNLGGFSGSGGLSDALALVFGIGRDLDGTDSSAIGFGPTAFGPQLAGAHRTDDNQTVVPILGGSPSGTFTITYDAAGDDLALGAGALSFPLLDTVQAIWGADDLFVSFGIRGNAYALTPGETYLDNFNIVSGRVIPEPGTVAMLLLAAGSMFRRQCIR